MPAKHKKLEEPTAEESVKKTSGLTNPAKKEERSEEFLKRMMDRQQTSTAKVQRGNKIYLPANIAYAMGMQDNMSCRVEREGTAVVVTPLKEAISQVNVFTHGRGLQLLMPKYILTKDGLQIGDYVEWTEEAGKFLFRKVEGAGESRTAVRALSYSAVAITIPLVIVNELKLEKGMCALWTFEEKEGEKRLSLEFRNENPHIGIINKYKNYFRLLMPEGTEEWLGGNEVNLNVVDEKLYITKKV